MASDYSLTVRIDTTHMNKVLEDSFKKFEAELSRLQFGALAGAPYAQFLEYGTPLQRKRLPQPRARKPKKLAPLPMRRAMTLSGDLP